MTHSNVRDGWKVLTHDYRSPIQGGEPLWDGVTLPVTLPQVSIDTSDKECAVGWNYCASLADALFIGGLWPTGRPSVGFQVTAGPDAIQRQAKRRSSTLTLLRLATEREIQDAILEKSGCFGEYAAIMAEQQILWRQALARPFRDVERVEAGLRLACDTRTLAWALKRYDNTQDARAARAAWNAWAAWAAWAARAAWAVYFAVHKQWTRANPTLLTDGIQDAYLYGLDVVIPTGPNELGWSMSDGTT